MKSVELLRYQASEVKDALLELRDETNDALTKTEAQHYQRMWGLVASVFAAWYGMTSSSKFKLLTS